MVYYRTAASRDLLPITLFPLSGRCITTERPGIAFKKDLFFLELVGFCWVNEIFHPEMAFVAGNFYGVIGVAMCLCGDCLWI